MHYYWLIAFIIFLVIVIFLAACFWNAGCGVSVCDCRHGNEVRYMNINGQLMPMPANSALNAGLNPAPAAAANVGYNANQPNWAEGLNPSTESVSEHGVTPCDRQGGW